MDPLTIGAGALAVGSSLFGKDNDKPKTMSTLTDQQQFLMDALINQMMNTKKVDGELVYDGMKGATKYSGTLSPDYFSNLKGDIRSAIRGSLSGKPAGTISNDAMERRYRQSVMNPLMQTYQNEIAPAIREGFGNAGGLTSRMGTSLANALTKIGTQASSELANMQWQKEQTNAQLANDAANRRLNAAGLGAQLGQQSLNTKYQDFLRTAKENNPYMAMALQLVNSQQQAAYANNGNPFMNMLQGGLSGAIMGNSGIGSKLGMTGTQMGVLGMLSRL